MLDAGVEALGVEGLGQIVFMGRFGAVAVGAGAHGVPQAGHQPGPLTTLPRGVDVQRGGAVAGLAGDGLVGPRPWPMRVGVPGGRSHAVAAEALGVVGQSLQGLLGSCGDPGGEASLQGHHRACVA